MNSLKVDDAETKEDLLNLLASVQKDCQVCIGQLEASLSAKKFAEAKEHLIVLRYLLSLENSIKEKGNCIGIVLWMLYSNSIKVFELNKFFYILLIVFFYALIHLKFSLQCNSQPNKGKNLTSGKWKIDKWNLI